jgi:hypothetical protein
MAVVTYRKLGRLTKGWKLDFLKCKLFCRFQFEIMLYIIKKKMKRKKEIPKLKLTQLCINLVV